MLTSSAEIVHLLFSCLTPEVLAIEIPSWFLVTFNNLSFRHSRVCLQSAYTSAKKIYTPNYKRLPP